MNIFQELDTEWDRLCRSKAACRRLSEWSARSPEVRAFPDLGVLVEFANRRGQARESDQVLAVLAHRAVDDDLAARTLLQAVMPGMRSLARRYRSVVASAGESPEGLVVSLTYERIRTYPFQSRPQRIAANVLLDTRQRLQRTVGRVGPITVSLEDLPFEPPSGDCEPNPFPLLNEAVALRVIGARDANLITATRLHGRPVAELAARLGCLPQTLRQRRRRAERRLLALFSC